MNRWLGILALIVLGNSASAEIVYCRFEQQWKPMTLAKWDTKRGTLITQHGYPARGRKYSDVRVVSDLLPYGDRGITLVVFGDVPALHLRLVNNATLPSDPTISYPYEAYWGNIPGRLSVPMGPLVLLDTLFNKRRTKEFGSRGVCWTKALPGRSVESDGKRKSKGNNGGKHRDRQPNKGKGGEKGKNR